jgi:hypothetical protein
LNNLSKYDVLAIQPRSGNGGDEELRAIGILAGIGHRQKTRFRVLELEVLICEFVAIDRLSASSITLSEVTSL